MKTLNDYLAMSYRLEIVRDDAEGGFVASYPDLPGCITCGETEEEAVKNALDAKRSGWKLRWRMGLPSLRRTVWRHTPGSSSCACPAACTARWQSIRSGRVSA